MMQDSSCIWGRIISVDLFYLQRSTTKKTGREAAFAVAWMHRRTFERGIEQDTESCSAAKLQLVKYD